MDLEGIMLSEVRERQIPYDLTYKWNLKKKKTKNQKQMNTFKTNKKQKKIHKYRELVAARGVGERGKMGEEE